MQAWRAAIGSLLVGLACSPEAQVEAPPGEYATLVVFAGGPQGNPAEARVEVIDLRADRASRSFAGVRDHTFALYYLDAVESLRLAPGRIDYDPDGRGTLPEPDRLRRLGETWEEASDLPEEIRTFRFRPFSTLECASQGGCYLDSEAETCTPSCPPPDAPDAPAFDRYPALPLLTPCPPGWRERAEDPLVLCEPQPFDGASCGADELALPGLGCTRIGTPCPTGTTTWTEPLPAGSSVVFVREGASGAAGTRADPVGTLARAIDLLSAGGAIALARGRYPGDVELAENVWIAGACASGTMLTGNVRAATTATLSNLSLLGRLSAKAGAELHLAEVILDEGGAIELDGPAHARLERCWLRGPGTEGITARFGSGSRGEVTESVIDDAEIEARSGGQLQVADCRIAGPSARIRATEASFLRIARTRIEGARYGITVFDGATAEIGDLSARTSSEAIQIFGGGLRLARAHFEGAANAALRITSASATVSDLVVRTEESPPGAGVLLERAGTDAVLDRAWLDEISGVGVLVSDRATAELRDVVVRRTRGPGEPAFGIAVTGGRLTLRRARLEDNEAAGLVVQSHRVDNPWREEDGFAELEDVRIIGNGANGLRQWASTHVVGRRLVLADNGGASWYLDPDRSSGEISELSITGARPREGPCTTLDGCRPSGLWTSQTDGLDGPGYHVRRFVIGPPANESVTRGVILSDLFNLEMSDGVIRGHSIGVDILSDRFPLWRFLVRVQVSDNEVPIARPADR
ncbi:MAG: hypothetical protein IT384_09100 [Deltaproteobacteria bacterium]|nr:hypothetical protein [Deltaproteobacteria bacterium]